MTPLSITTYLLAFLLVGLVNLRRSGSPAGFYLAERRGSALLVGSSLLATIVGASATLGLAGNAFRDGLPAAWYLLSGVLGLLLLAFVFAERIQRLEVYTLPELLERHYGPAVKIAASILIAIAWLGVIAAQIGGLGLVLKQAMGGSAEAWTIAAALAVVGYTALGGQLSVLRTDAWQLAVMLIGFGTGLGLALTRVGGLAGLHAVLPPELLRFPVNGAMPPAKVLTWLLAVGLPFCVGPDMVSRLLCARDAVAARRAALGTALALVPVAFTIALLGLIARAVAPGSEPKQALLTTIAMTLPPWAAGWMAAALMAALMSSASACLLTSATILVVDLRPAGAPEPPLRRTRLVLVAVGLLATAVALRHGNLIASLLWAYGIYTGGVVVPVIAGFWRERLGLTTAGALAATVLGGGVALAGSLTAHDWTLAAIAASALALAAYRQRKADL